MYQKLAILPRIQLLAATVVGETVGSARRQTSEYIVGRGLDQVVTGVAGGNTTQRQQVGNDTSDVRSGHGSSGKCSLYYPFING